MKKQIQFIILLVILLLSNILIKSQDILVYGQIFESKTQIPLQFVNISVKGTTIGTISNLSGKFRLKTPSKYIGEDITISSIGYKNVFTKIIKGKYYKINLDKEITELSEVIVMPDSSLLELLRKAYTKIPENYYNIATRSNGFFRKTMVAQDTIFLYFGEAVLDVFKTSYKLKNKGHVGLIKSRINKFPFADTINAEKFYGGALYPVSSDFVKHRSNFLNPANFKHYKYEIKGVTTNNGKPAYIISFQNKDLQHGKFKGEMIIDKASLSYLQIKMELTDSGIKARNNKLSSSLKCTNRKRLIIYSKHGVKYFLKYIYDKESLKNKKTNYDLTKINEYLTTSVDSINNSPIPYDEQINEGAVFSDYATNYNQSFWKDYNILYHDSLLSKSIKTQYSDTVSEGILSKKYNNQKKERNDKIIKVLSNFIFDIQLSVQKMIFPYNTLQTVYQPDNNYFISGNMSVNPAVQYSLYWGIGYYFTKRLSSTFASGLSFNKNLNESVKFGFSYDFVMKNIGRKILLSLGVNYFYSNFGYFQGTYSTNSNFTISSKKINSDKINLFTGKNTQGLSPEFALKVKIKPRMQLFLSYNYSFPIKTNDYLYVKENSGFILTRKKANLELNDRAIEYFENSEAKKYTSISLSNHTFMFGLRFTVK